MKESDITQPVIDKCKQIAELWRMKIYEGCWYVHKNGDGAIQLHNFGMKTMPYDYYGLYSLLPIPSISDVLRKLRELGVSVALQDHILLTYAVGIMDESNEYKPSATESSPLEALLSALFEVLKNSDA